MPTPLRRGDRRWQKTMTTCALLSLMWLLMIGQPVQVDAQVSIFEPFDGMTTQDPAWMLSGSATLTGEGDGWLQLTPNATDQTGAAILDSPFASDQPIVISFEYAVYGQGAATGAHIVFRMDFKPLHRTWRIQNVLEMPRLVADTGGRRQHALGGQGQQTLLEAAQGRQCLAVAAGLQRRGAYSVSPSDGAADGAVPAGPPASASARAYWVFQRAVA